MSIGSFSLDSLSLDMIGTGTTIVFLVFLALGLLGGLRGFSKSLLNLIKHLAAAVFALPVTKLLAKTSVSTVFESAADALKTLGEKMGSGIDLSDAPNLTAAMEKLLIAVAMLLMFISVYLVLLVVFSIVLKILMIIVRIIKGKKKKSGLSRLVGMAIGLCIGFLSFLILTMPIIGLAHTVNDATATLLDCEDDSKLKEYEETFETVNEASGYIVDNKIVDITWTSVQKSLYRTVASVETDEGTAVLDDEIQEAVVITKDVFVLTGTEISAYGPKQITAINHIADEIAKAKLLPQIVAGFLSDACTKWLNNETFLGIAKPEVGEPACYMMDGVYLMFSTANSQNLGEDLQTFAEMISTMSEASFFSALDDPDALMNLLTDKDTLTSLIETIESNEHTAVLLDSVVDMAADLITDALNIEDEDIDVRETFDDITNNMTDILNDTAGIENIEERKEAVSNQVDTFLQDNYDITVDPEIADGIASALVDNMGDMNTDDIKATDYLIALASGLIDSGFSFEEEAE